MRGGLILCKAAARVSTYFARKKGLTAKQYGKRIEEQFGDHQVRCPNCGSRKMLLIRIWSKSAGVVYDAPRDDPHVCADPGSVAVVNPVAQAAPAQLQFAF